MVCCVGVGIDEAWAWLVERSEEGWRGQWVIQSGVQWEEGLVWGNGGCFKIDFHEMF